MKTLLLLAALALPGCAANKQFLAAQLANTDVSGGVSFEGATVTIARVNGRNSVAVDVDAKQIQRAVNR